MPEIDLGSVVGPKGPQGATGPTGPEGKQGPQGQTGEAGKSAYQAARDGGSTGTEAEFNAIMAIIDKHAGRHKTGGADPLTAADVGALPRDGSAAMTGNLHISKTLPRMLIRNTTIGESGVPAGFLLEQSSKGVTYLCSCNDATDETAATGDYRGLLLHNANSAKSVRDAFQFHDVVDGKRTVHNVLHTGNKPSGEYPGTNSKTSQTILSDAIGNMVLICGNGKATIVTKDGGVCLNDGSVISASEVNFTNGTLTIASQNASINAILADGKKYQYTVV